MGGETEAGSRMLRDQMTKRVNRWREGRVARWDYGLTMTLHRLMTCLIEVEVEVDDMAAQRMDGPAADEELQQLELLREQQQQQVRKEPRPGGKERRKDGRKRKPVLHCRY